LEIRHSESCRIAYFAMLFFRCAGYVILIMCAILSHAAPSDEVKLRAQVNRGKLLYLQHCVICHQSSGQGSPGTFPPLAKSDYLATNTEGSIFALVQGLSGRITVNGTNYDGVMPPVLLDDTKVADVLTYARNAFGNAGQAITPEEVRAVRGKSKFPTYDKLVKAHAYPALPKPAEGMRLRELVKLPDHGTRITTDDKALYVLTGGGDVWRVEVPSGKTNLFVRGKDYIDRKRGEPSAMGLCFDRDRRRLYISCNQRYERGVLVTNEVTIFRTTASNEKSPIPWFQTRYPWGIGPFNHGVSHIEFGPDRLLYVSSGSRTDGNEPGTDPRYYKGGEFTNTACLWRLDPAAESPACEIFADGLRNCYGFCWNDRGELFGTDNGPDADAPEELNRLEKGKHYGFPFQFSDWTNKPYAYTPAPPQGSTFIRPVANLGPAAGGKDAGPLYTFDPHSSPAGIIYLGGDCPEAWRESFLVVRFGHLIKKPHDHGFDLLQMRLEKHGEGYVARTTTVLAPLGRPLDLVLLNRKVYILEYSRQTDNKGEFGSLPGRILELSLSP
jgi:glucose/arabinose dehydrogenase/mono/diheme cytochrome c family protein